MTATETWFMATSDTIMVLTFGEKIAKGTPAQIREHPDVIEPT